MPDMPKDKYYDDAVRLLALHRQIPGAQACDQLRCRGEQWPCAAVQVATRVVGMYDDPPAQPAHAHAHDEGAVRPLPAAPAAPATSAATAGPPSPRPSRPAAPVAPPTTALTPWVAAAQMPASGWRLTDLAHALPSTLPMARDVGNIMDLIFTLGFATIKQLAVRLGRSQPEIGRSLAALREMGWIAYTAG